MPRRPNSSTDEILALTFQLIADHDVSGVSVDMVAARAGVSKATIYRRWRSREELIQATIDGLLPGTTVIPTLIGGRTDAAHLKSIKTYGFWPTLPSERVQDYMGLAHGHNERVHVDDVGFATRFGWNLVTSFAAKGSDSSR